MILNTCNINDPGMIEISHQEEKFYIWTKKAGNNPHVKILLIHGGPGSIHDYLECFGTNLPEYECCYYDQLGSGKSQRPILRPDLWTVDQFVDEVEQVRQAFGLNNTNFYLCGHSWGGLLAQEYALRYQQHLKGLIISNMISNMPASNEYFNKHRQFQDEEKADLMKFIKDHYCSSPRSLWPPALERTLDPCTTNIEVYYTMQGLSLILTEGNLKSWDISNKLHEILVPTLFISGKRDAMDNEQIEAAAKEVKNGNYWNSDGGHFCMYDDQDNYFQHIREFIENTERLYEQKQH